jgi:hypothetical protein
MAKHHAIEFLMIQLDPIIEAFKIEQKIVIDEYHETKKRETLAIERIRKMGRIVSKQENMILET